MKHIALVAIGIVVVMSIAMGMIWAIVKPKIHLCYRIWFDFKRDSPKQPGISRMQLQVCDEKPGYDDTFQYLQHGNVSSNISVRAEIRYGLANWKSSPLRIGIYCQPENVMLERNFQPADCYVDL
ncbi:hypothetical protein FEM48_Zijuj02G0035900 [Ziziphus jujuba var. spinosa]|uniref:Uncharacterized protein n=1 Tax=Ziziphus jujuba var. spinosa TaxID=714518 RepID=A0A978VTE0_ZIZJJ|nr:hypothetical protein FEM48_Zijuj02G0035900 [Ziziphus jujuba var. spinosa]